MISLWFTAGLVVVVALAAAGATTTPAAGDSCASKVGDGEVLQRTTDAIVFLSQQRFTVNPNTVVACWRSSGRTVELGRVIYDQRQIPRASQKLYQFRFAGRFAAFVVGYDRGLRRGDRRRPGQGLRPATRSPDVLPPGRTR